MTTALVSPYARQMAFALGVFAPGAKMSFFVAGSSTPATTWSSADLADIHENTHPVVASSAGLFGPIYLAPGVVYDVTLTDTNDVPIWAQDDITTGGVSEATFNVVAYGATPGVSVDSVTAIRAAVDAAEAAASATTPAVVFFPAMFRSSGQILSETSYVKFKGVGIGSGIQFDDANLNAGLKIAPPAASVVTSALLASNTAIGDRTITLAAAAGANFAAGEWIYVEDDHVDYGSFITYIESILGDVLTLQDAVPCVLRTSQNATCYGRAAATAVLQGVEVSDLSLTCATPAPTLFGHNLRLFNCHAPRVRNVSMNGASLPNLGLFECDDALVSDCLAENGITSNNAGFSFVSSMHCALDNCDARHTVFGMTTSKSPWTRVSNFAAHNRNTQVASGRGVKFQSGSNFSSVTGSASADRYLFGGYFQDSAYCSVTGVTVFSTGVTADTLEHGWEIAGNQPDLCHDCKVSDCTFVSCKGFGVAVAPTFSVTARNIYATVTGNRIRLCKSGGVIIFGSSYCLVADNHILQDPADVITAAIVVSSLSDECTVRNNKIVSTGAALVGIDSSAGGGKNDVTPNALGVLVSQTFAAGDFVQPWPAGSSATLFETAGRFGTVINGGGGNTFNTTGVALATSATINSSAGVSWRLDADAPGNIMAANPQFAARLAFTTKGSDGIVYVGVGAITFNGTSGTFTDRHLGFKITWAASGAASVFATQGDGTTEKASSALTTVAAGDSLDLYLRKRGTSQVEYSWRKNGGVLSTTTILTDNIPTTGDTATAEAVINNANVASASTITLFSANYSR